MLSRREGEDAFAFRRKGEERERGKRMGKENEKEKEEKEKEKQRTLFRSPSLFSSLSAHCVTHTIVTFPATSASPNHGH